MCSSSTLSHCPFQTPLTPGHHPSRRWGPAWTSSPDPSFLKCLWNTCPVRLRRGFCTSVGHCGGVREVKPVSRWITWGSTHVVSCPPPPAENAPPWQFLLCPPSLNLGSHRVLAEIRAVGPRAMQPCRPQSGDKTGVRATLLPIFVSAKAVCPSFGKELDRNL